MAVDLERRTEAMERTEASRLVAKLRGDLGAELLTLATGASKAAIDAWVRGRDEPSLDLLSRMKTLGEAVDLLLEVDHPSVVRAWFAGSNELLGGRAPAAVAAENPHAVMRAAIEFRAYG